MTKAELIDKMASDAKRVNHEAASHNTDKLNNKPKQIIIDEVLLQIS